MLASRTPLTLATRSLVSAIGVAAFLCATAAQGRAGCEGYLKNQINPVGSSLFLFVADKGAAALPPLDSPVSPCSRGECRSAPDWPSAPTVSVVGFEESWACPAQSFSAEPTIGRFPPPASGPLAPLHFGLPIDHPPRACA